MSPMAFGGRDRYSFELALDRYICYPMESVELSVRVRLENPMRTILCLHLPHMTEIEAVHMDDVDDNHLTVYTRNFDGKLVAVQLSKYMEPGQTSELRLTIRLNSIRMNHYLNFCAWMAADVPDFEGDFFTEPRGSRSVELTVKADASYMRFLPEMYSYDDFMNRFLMMFESFWKPISQQISMGESYYDPDLTPSKMQFRFPVPGELQSLCGSSLRCIPAVMWRSVSGKLTTWCWEGRWGSATVSRSEKITNPIWSLFQ